MRNSWLYIEYIYTAHATRINYVVKSDNNNICILYGGCLKFIARRRVVQWIIRRRDSGGGGGGCCGVRSRWLLACRELGQVDQRQQIAERLLRLWTK